MDTRSIKKTMALDTALYLPAKAVEGILGILILNIFTTYFFTPEVISDYNFGIILANMTNLILMGWISQSSTRYVSHYQNEGREADFFKTIIVVWAICSFVIVSVSVLLLFLFKNQVPVELYRLYIFVFIGFNMVQILLPLLAFMRRIRLNLMLSVGSSLMKLLLTCLLVYILKNNDTTPVAALLGYGITDLVVALIIVWRLKLVKHFRTGKVSREILKTLFSFSLPFLGVNITTALLNLSDRLIVKPLAGDAAMGIYTQNYQIPGVVFPMISIGVMRGVYPILLKSFRKDEPKQAAELLSQSIRYFLLLGLPAMTGLISLSSLISRVILGPGYFEDGFVISFVAAGVFCSGFAEFSNKAWEMSAHTKPIFINAAISTVVNIGANILLIPTYGYRVAAISTFFSFFLYLCLSVYGSRKQIRWYIAPKGLIRMLSACAAMFLYLYGVKRFLSDSFWSLLVLVLTGAGVYLLMLLLLGELKDVTALFGNRQKNRESV